MAIAISWPRASYSIKLTVANVLATELIVCYFEANVVVANVGS